MSDIKHISSSQLSKNLSIQKSKLDELLISAKYIEQSGNEYSLTKLGEEQGGKYINHAKFGRYIAWPENIDIPDKTLTQGKEFLNSTGLGKKYNLSARKINMMLSEIGWIEKYLKGWTITALGTKNGGIQKENLQSGIPSVEWPSTVFNNSAFIAVIQEVKGEASNDVTEKIEKSKQSDFRTKFEAKHRATDGHFVRSKAEMLIDNWLYMAEIVHAYERRLPIEEEVYCDFYIPTGKVYIEFWGLENDPKYTERKKIKKEIYEKYEFKLIELTDEDVFNLDDVLPKMLLRFGVLTY